MVNNKSQLSLLNKTIKMARKSDLYKLNTNNPAIKQLIKLDWNLIKGSEEELVMAA